MDSIADVKAAAERAKGRQFLSDPDSRDISTLAEFANAILSAPGMTAERLEKIQRREQAATDGPWEIDDRDELPKSTVWTVDGDIAVADIPRHALASYRDDGQFIADARQAVPELLAEADRLIHKEMPVEPDKIP